MKQQKERGMGLIYQRGKRFWIQFNVKGKRYRMPTGSTNRVVAVDMLKKQIAKAESGAVVGPRVDRITLDELLEILFNNYRAKERRSIKRVEDAGNHLKSYFGGDARVVTLTSDRIAAYAVKRQEKAANGTINRELAALKHALKLAHKAGRISSVPAIEMLPEHNVRQGFLSHGDFLALLDALPEYLRDAIWFLYRSGWRRNEMTSLEWRDIERDGLKKPTAIRLRPEVSKTQDGRLLPLDGELLAIIERADKARHRYPDCRFVFSHDGRRIVDFRFAWARATAQAGLGKVLVHDLRRCAVRNLSRSGVPEAIAMRVTGHKTRSIFDRYNIVSEEDLKQALSKVEAHLEGQPVNSSKATSMDQRR